MVDVLMNARTLVMKTLEFDCPQRIPRQMFVLPWALLTHPNEVKSIQQKYPNDIISAPGFYEKQPTHIGKRHDIGIYVDEWGCTFENVYAGIQGEVKEPLVETLDDIAKVRTPDEMLTIDIEKINSFCRHTDKFVISNCSPRPFERLQFIRGTANVMMDLAMQAEESLAVLEIIHNYYLKEFEVWAQTDVDALGLMDDWGSQTALLISPEMWRKYFKTAL